MTTGSSSLLSLVLSLRPLEPAAAAQSFGRAAHAILLDAVRATDPALAEALHAGSEARPFTVSNLLGVSRRDGLLPAQASTLRFTALSEPVARALLAATAVDGPLSVGATLRLDAASLRVEAAAVDPAAHPWAEASRYEELAAPWLVGQAPPPPRLSLRFFSPTTFRSKGLHVPVPLPGLVFGSLLERWNAFAPLALPAETRRFADECLALSDYRLSTRPILAKDGGLRIGAVGMAQYTATNRDRYWLSVLNLLADYAFFAGAGAGTAMGLGQCRRANGDSWGRAGAAAQFREGKP